MKMNRNFQGETPPIKATPFTPAEFQEVWLQLLAAGTGHAGRLFTDLFTEDEIEEVLGSEIVARLRATVRMVKAAIKAAAKADPTDLS